MDAVQAKVDIEYLRRWYAWATDAIGRNTAAGIAEGREIYHRIFTTDCEIRVTDGTSVSLEATGPDAWVDVVVAALGTTYAQTQHLIGTQIVELHSMPARGDAGGEASMSSHLQAWQVTPDGTLHRVMGTYHDKVRYTPGAGWQIYDMTLATTTRDVVQLEHGEPPR